MIFVILLYIVLLLIFFGISGVIILHAAKLGPLVPKFRWMISLFGIISIVVVVFSIFLLVTLSNNDSPALPTPSGSSNGSLNF